MNIELGLILYIINSNQYVNQNFSSNHNNLASIKLKTVQKSINRITLFFFPYFLLQDKFFENLSYD